MATVFSDLEQRLFRGINGVVEPLVRKGFASSAHVPASLIVLESTGFRSGQQRKTPLWSLGLGRYRLVSTGRGRRSFWVRNLYQQPETRYFLGGKAVDSEAIVMAPGFNNLGDWELGPLLSRLFLGLSRLVDQGWAFVLLVPGSGGR